jgi:putative ATP-binding cassette transporter
MKRVVRILIVTIVITLIVGIISGSAIYAGVQKSDQIWDKDLLTAEGIEQINEYAEKNMKDGKVPGMSVVIVKGGKTVYQNCFGYADLENKKPVTPETLFEMGSTSKSFTALAILDMENKGLLKLKDPVTKYIPWFKVKYEDSYSEITVEELLHHTSGIPTNAINDIPIGEDDKALERTVKNLIKSDLANEPGSTLAYSTANYDVLGLIIQEISGLSYEEYMKKSILDKLGLKNTYLFRSEAMKHDLAKGYKLGFLKARAYDAPMFRGNTPAGYFIMNANDMAHWLKIQLGTDGNSTFDKSIIEKSHIANNWVSPWPDGSMYAGGWIVYQRQGPEIGHIGYNPNYSSFIMFRPNEQFGVGILANIDTVTSRRVGQGIINILKNEQGWFSVPADPVLSTDTISSVCF